MLTQWPCPRLDGSVGDELAVAFAEGREKRVLLCPPLFDEHNKFRRQMVEIMRRLTLSGIDSALPDCPGWNESTEPLGEQTLAHWRSCMTAAATHFGATHCLTFRAGALLAPGDLPGWRYAPVAGRQILRAMIRARILAAREAGRSETMDDLQDLGRREGIELAGWTLGHELFREMETAQLSDNPVQQVIEQDLVGGRGLWLRAEPDEDPEQADAIAAIVAMALQAA